MVKLSQYQAEDSASDDEENESETQRLQRQAFRRHLRNVRELIQDHLKLDPSQEDDWYTIQVLLSYPPKTVAGWGAHWRVMIQDGHTLTPRSFFDYILRIVHEKELSNGTVKQSRGAIRAWYKVSGMAGEQAQAESLIKGVLASNLDRGVGKRGGIECDMCRQMLSHPQFSPEFRTPSPSSRRAVYDKASSQHVASISGRKSMTEMVSTSGSY